MSNRSRGRHRFDTEPVAAPDPDTVARDAAVGEAFEALESGDKKSGLAKLIDVVLGDRDKALTPDMPKAAAPAIHHVEPFRAPTPYESAILVALGARTTVIDRTHIGGTVISVPVNIASGGVFGGTVEPWRIDKRRRRNKAARRARKGRLPNRARGHVRQGVRAATAGSWRAAS